MVSKGRFSNNLRLMLGVALFAGLIGFGVVALLFWNREQPRQRTADVISQTASESGASPTPARASASPAATPTDAPARDGSFIDKLFGADESVFNPAQAEHWATTFLRITLRLLLATLLTGVLAYRPRRNSRALKRNPFVAQTQILLAVVAAALMMIVGDSAARAFGIFAAASLVRFRTNIRDPKEITILLVCLAIGLAAGVGRWEVAVSLSFFILLLLWALEYQETRQVFRAMEVTVKTRNVATTNSALKSIFRKYKFNAELRTLDREDTEDPMGCITYYVDISPLVSTDQLSAEMLSADSANIDSVEWSQQKSTSYFYQ